MNQNKINLKQICRRFLSGDAYLSVNKYLIYRLGLKEAVLLSDLISKDQYFENKGLLDTEGFFFNTRKDRKKSTCLSYDLQYKIVKNLEKLNIIETKRKLTPAKTHFKINYDVLGEILSEDKELNKESEDIVQSKDFTYSSVSKKRTLINNNKLINNNSSLKNPKELNNAPTTRASRCNEKIKPISTQSTSKHNKKDSLLTKGSHEPIKMKISTYVEHWNTLPNVTHHSYFNNRDLPSKTYKTAHKLCSQLSRGMFNNNEISKTFLIRHKIDISILTRKFTKPEIIKTLSKLSIMFAPGHWAGDSNGLKPNLSCLLYNPMNQSSMFLAMFVNPDMSEKTLEYKKPKDNYPGLTRKLLPLLDKQPKDNKQLFLLFKGIESIVKYYRTIKINKSHVNMSLDIWFDYYIDFLDSSCDNIEINYILIKTGNWLWEKFINEYEEEWYVDHSNRWKDRDPDIVY